jgi:hypothetical protein
MQVWESSGKSQFRMMNENLPAYCLAHPSMETAVQIEASKLPDNVKYAVIGAMAAAAVAVFLNLSNGDFPSSLIATAFGVAIYYTVYAKLTTDVSAAKTAALVCAGLAAFFLLFSMMTRNPTFMVINLIAGAGLGYAFMQLQELEKKAAAPPS